MSLSTRTQATVAVNELLNSILPGSSQVKVQHKRKSSEKGSKAQLINRNLKKRLELQERDAFRIRRKQKKIQKKKIGDKKAQLETFEQKAKLLVLKKHRDENTLTEHEKEYLDKLLKKNVRSLKSWEVDEKEEMEDLQKKVLVGLASNKSVGTSKRRTHKKKQFKQQLSKNVSDHRYPGLTPGLAPVGLSDEEDSD